MLVIDPHRATPCIPLTVGDPDRADDDLARLADASPIPDPVPIPAFEYDKALFLAWVQVRPHYVRTSLRGQLRLEEFAIRRLGRRAKHQALERTSALPMTIGWLSASAILPARELGSRATPTCDSGVPM